MGKKVLLILVLILFIFLQTYVGTAFTDDEDISQEYIEYQDDNEGIYYKNAYVNTGQECKEYQELIDAKLGTLIGRFYEVDSDMYNAMYEWLYHDDKECLKACCVSGYKPDISDLSYISYLDTCKRMAFTCCCDRPELNCKYYNCLSEQNESQDYGSIGSNEENGDTYIFYINGMNTEEDIAKKDLKYISDKYKKDLEKNYPEYGDSAFELIYNESISLKSDLQEVFLQKNIEKDGPNITWEILATGLKPTEDLNLLQKLRGYFSPDNKMIIDSLYETVTFGVNRILYALKSGARVIIIAHSQGNLFANDLAEGFISKYPELSKSIGVVSIATPANKVVTDSSKCWFFSGAKDKPICYATDVNDDVINGLRACFIKMFKVLPANVVNEYNTICNEDNLTECERYWFGDSSLPTDTIDSCLTSISLSGHSMIENYLNKFASEKIITYNIYSLYENLKPPTEKIIQEATELYNKLF